MARKYGSFPVDPRDLPRVPAGRLRPAGPARPPARPVDARARPRRGRDAVREPVQRVAALRLHRDVHVRGRHASRGAARAGAVARPRPAARAARPGRAARPARRRRARGRGAAVARRSDDARRAPRPAPAPRRPSERRVRRGARGAATARTACDSRARRGRRAADRGRGRRSLPGRAGRDAAVRPPPMRFSTAGPTRCGSSCSGIARGRGPFTSEQAIGAVPGETSREILRRLERDDLLVRGELRPGGTEREWCDPDVLRRLRRTSLAALRREVEPVEQEALTVASPDGTASIAVGRFARRSSRSRRSRFPSR